MTRHRAFMCEFRLPRLLGMHQLRASHRQGARTSEHSDSSFPPLSLVLSLLPGVDVGEPQTTNEKRPPRPLTAYSVRLHTGHGRGAALSEPLSGVNICLIGHDGRAVLHQISPVNDPEAALACFDRVCQVVDASVGVDCHTIKSVPAAGSAATSPSAEVFLTKTPRTPQPRFLQGHVDEVVFLAEELGPLAGVLIGIEQGTWVLDELTISSSRTHHVDRFVCRRLLGSQPGFGAAFLTPVPLGAVMYGSVAVTKSEAAILRAINTNDYQKLKQQILVNTALITAGGGALAGLVAGFEDGTIPFALGGMTGLVYQWLLQQGVDGIGAQTTLESQSTIAEQTQVHKSSMILNKTVQPGSSWLYSVRQVLSSFPTRLAFLGAAVAAAVVILGADGTPLSQDSVGFLFVGLLGFLLPLKLAVIGVSLSPTEATKAHSGV